MTEFKANFPTASSLYTEAKKEYDNSFRKKLIDAGAGSPSTGAFQKHNHQIRLQYEANQTKLRKALQKNKDALRKSNLSAEEKKAKSAQLLEQVKKIDANLRAKYDKDFIKPSKPTAKKARGGKTVNKKVGGKLKTAAKKKPQSGHNRLY